MLDIFQSGFEHKYIAKDNLDPLAFTSLVLGSQMCTSMPGFYGVDTQTRDVMASTVPTEPQLLSHGGHLNPLPPSAQTSVQHSISGALFLLGLFILHFLFLSRLLFFIIDLHKNDYQ